MLHGLGVKRKVKFLESRFSKRPLVFEGRSQKPEREQGLMEL